MSDVVEELAEHAQAAKAHLEAYEQEMAHVNRLLPVVRTEGRRPDGKRMGPKDIESLIGGLLDRGTISRKTAEAAGTKKAKGAESGS